MKKIKIFLILCVLFSLYFLISAYSYVSAISDNLYNSVLRLHVIANSNSNEDQNLKYKIRDNLLNYMNLQCSDFSNKQEVIDFAKNHLTNFKEIAEKTIFEEGYSYPVTVELGNFEFPTKNYGDISFPAGFYDAIRVKIGKSSGQNWWCVMFPPLCFVDTNTGLIPDSSKELLHENLSNESYNIVSTSTDSNVSFKFKLIELFEKTGLITAKK